MTSTRLFSSILIVSLLLGIAGIALPQSKATKTESRDTIHTKNPLVTFVELGSVKCIPCRQMQPVMKAIEQKYGDQVKVVFHDVWKSDQYEYAEKYEIKLIPTQVFLDNNGKEFFRHEGFFPEAEIDKLLHKRGLKIRNGG
jgi:thioredoxin 1